MQKEMLRENADYALVELIFSVTDEKQKESYESWTCSRRMTKSS